MPAGYARRKRTRAGAREDLISQYEHLRDAAPTAWPGCTWPEQLRRLKAGEAVVEPAHAVSDFLPCDLAAYPYDNVRILSDGTIVGI